MLNLCFLNIGIKSISSAKESNNPSTPPAGETCSRIKSKRRFFEEWSLFKQVWTTWRKVGALHETDSRFD